MHNGARVYYIYYYYVYNHYHLSHYYDCLTHIINNPYDCFHVGRSELHKKQHLYMFVYSMDDYHNEHIVKAPNFHILQHSDILHLTTNLTTNSNCLKFSKICKNLAELVDLDTLHWVFPFFLLRHRTKYVIDSVYMGHQILLVIFCYI